MNFYNTLAPREVVQKLLAQNLFAHNFGCHLLMISDKTQLTSYFVHNAQRIIEKNV